MADIVKINTAIGSMDVADAEFKEALQLDQKIESVNTLENKIIGTN